MANKQNRYKMMERYMTYALCADAAGFILYLLFAGLGIIWLKVLMVIFCLLLSGLLLAFLHLTRELTKRRSLWITVSASAVLICLLFSLLLNFPSPSDHKPQNNKESSVYTLTKHL